MNKAKVLIHVVGGVAYWTAEGEVDVVLIDEDNIKAGDGPVALSEEWRGFAERQVGLIETQLGSVPRRS